MSVQERACSNSREQRNLSHAFVAFPSSLGTPRTNFDEPMPPRRLFACSLVRRQRVEAKGSTIAQVAHFHSIANGRSFPESPDGGKMPQEVEEQAFAVPGVRHCDGGGGSGSMIRPASRSCASPTRPGSTANGQWGQLHRAGPCSCPPRSSLPLDAQRLHARGGNCVHCCRAHEIESDRQLQLLR